MGLWIQDIRFGFRMLKKTPGATAISVLAMALAIGACTTVFSIVNEVLLQPLPFAESDRLVAVWEHDLVGDPGTWRRPAQGNVAEYLAQTRIVQNLAAARNRSFTLTSFEDPDTPLMREVTAGYFPLLGVEPLLGRSFTPEEDRPGGPKVALLSYDLWQNRFGADPNVLGQTTGLDGEPYEIIGVMPPGFDNPVFQLDVRPQMWLPLALGTTGLERTGGGHIVLGRLAPNTTLEQAQAELDRISASIREQYPETDENRTALVVPAKEALVRGFRPALYLLLGAVLFVLLIACGNVANLLLAKAVSRQRELALRQALGAGMGRLISQLGVESFLLTGLGGGIGLLLAWLSLDLLLALVPNGFLMPQLASIHLDSNVLLFTLAVSVVTGMVFGVLPALQARSHNLNDSLSAGAVRSTAGNWGKSLRNLLVVGEIALSLLVLIGAGLMIRSFLSLQNLQSGFDPDHRLVFRVSVRGENYDEPSRRFEFYRQVIDGLREIPGVLSAGGIQGLPFFQFNEMNLFPEGQESSTESSRNAGFVLPVSDGFFRAFGTPLLRGRDFQIMDRADSLKVAILSQTLAEKLWPGEDPIGKMLRIEHPDLMGQFQIIGLAGDVQGVGQPPEPEALLYVPHAQAPFPSSFALVVHTTDEPMALLDSCKKVVARVDRQMPVYLARSLEAFVDALNWRLRFTMTLLSLFAGLALCLAATGIYAVLSYLVSQRRREIGIRMALGAKPRNVLGNVLRGAMLLTGLGLLAGLVAALALTRVLQGQLYGVTTTDPPTFGSIILLLAAVSLLASLLPALRASRVDPAIALRQE